MAVDVDEARLGDRGIIASLLDDYLHELADHREVAVGATDSRSYPYLDAYFDCRGAVASCLGVPGTQRWRWVTLAVRRTP